MAECKFCNFAENGDIADDREWLMDGKFYVSLNTSAAVDNGERPVFNHNRIDQEHEVLVGLTIINDFDSEEPILDLVINDYPSYEDADYLIYSEKQKINFCPICGRRLKDKKED